MDIVSQPTTLAFPQLDGIEHRFVDLPGLRTHVAESGRGDPVLLLHGFPQHWWEWRKVIPGLAARHRVLCPDLRGAGWTDAPRTGYGADQHVADLVALLDALDLDRVHLVAHDYGALVGFQLALNHPDRVRTFLCLATPHPFIRFSPRLLTVMPHLWFQSVIATPGLGPWLLRGGKLPRHLLRKFAAGPDSFTERDIELFVAPLREPARSRAASALYRDCILAEGMRIMTGGYRGAHLTTRTRMLFGREDPVAGPDLMGDLLGGYEDHADDLTIEFLDGASHYVADDRPDAVVDRALTLFAQP
ncbi:alpha/beta fold hydrolase [Longispora urticae]